MATPDAIADLLLAPVAAPDPALRAEDQDYLRRYPDVATAIRRGRFKSAREHFDLHGHFEGRMWPGEQAATPAEPRPKPTVAAQPVTAPTTPHSFDVVVASPLGIFLEGWIDDRAQRIIGADAVDIASGRRVPVSLFRCHRQDVQGYCIRPSPTSSASALRTGAPPKAGALAVKADSRGRRAVRYPPEWRPPPGLAQSSSICRVSTAARGRSATRSRAPSPNWIWASATRSPRSTGRSRRPGR